MFNGMIALDCIIQQCTSTKSCKNFVPLAQTSPPSQLASLSEPRRIKRSGETKDDVSTTGVIGLYKEVSRNKSILYIFILMLSHFSLYYRLFIINVK